MLQCSISHDIAHEDTFGHNRIAAMGFALEQAKAVGFSSSFS